MTAHGTKITRPADRRITDFDDMRSHLSTAAPGTDISRIIREKADPDAVARWASDGMIADRTPECARWITTVWCLTWAGFRRLKPSVPVLRAPSYRTVDHGIVTGRTVEDGFFEASA
jgi:hypothetical protein